MTVASLVECLLFAFAISSSAFTKSAWGILVLLLYLISFDLISVWFGVFYLYGGLRCLLCVVVVLV